MKNEIYSQWPQWHCKPCNIQGIEWANNEHCYDCCKKDGCFCYWPEKEGQSEYLGKQSPKITIDLPERLKKKYGN
jgi:hypothetical protein